MTFLAAVAVLFAIIWTHDARVKRRRQVDDHYQGEFSRLSVQQWRAFINREQRGRES